MKCSVCGITDKETRIIKAEKISTFLCRKHYLQWYRYGKFQKATLRDANEIILKEDYAEVVIYSHQKAGESSEEIARAIVGLEDVDRIKDFKWYLDTKGYAKSSRGNKNLFMHNLFIKFDGKVTDHINGNPLDNRRSNLRAITNTENIRHRVNLNKNNTSGHIGVYWNKRRQRWYACIMVDGRSINLGSSTNLEEAIAMRKAGEDKYFGEFKPSINGGCHR